MLSTPLKLKLINVTDKSATVQPQDSRSHISRLEIYVPHITSR